MLTAILLAALTSAGQGSVTTLAGNGSAGTADGVGSAAQLTTPNGLSLDQQGNAYVADIQSNTIRKIEPNGTVTTIAGSGLQGYLDGAAASAQFESPVGTAADASGNLFIPTLGHRIRKLDTGGQVSTFAGSGMAGSTNANGTNASFDNPGYVAFDNQGNLIVTDRFNHKIRKIDPQGNVTTLAGSGNQGSADGTAAMATFNRPFGVCVNSGDSIFIVDRDNNKIRLITPAGMVFTVAGSGASGLVDGQGPNAQFNNPHGCACDNQGNVFIADRSNHVIRRIDANYNVTTIAGAGIPGLVDGPALSAAFNLPSGIAYNPGPNTLVISDVGSHTIRSFELEPADTNTYCDTLVITDTLVVADTVFMWDTLYLRDTVWVYDTVFIQGMIEDNGMDHFMVYPNPFHEQVQVDYSLTKAANVRVSLLDMKGALITVMADERQYPGQFHLVATIPDEVLAGQAILLRLEIDNESHTIQLIRGG